MNVDFYGWRTCLSHQIVTVFVVFADVLAALVINTRYQGVCLRGLKSDAYLPVLFHSKIVEIVSKAKKF